MKTEQRNDDLQLRFVAAQQRQVLHYKISALSAPSVRQTTYHPFVVSNPTPAKRTEHRKVTGSPSCVGAFVLLNGRRGALHAPLRPFKSGSTEC